MGLDPGAGSTDATLVLALGARAIRRAGADPKTPVPGKRMQPWMQHHLTAARVVVQDQRLGIVEQNLPRHAAEGPEALSSPSNQLSCRSCPYART